MGPKLNHPAPTAVAQPCIKKIRHLCQITMESKAPSRLMCKTEPEPYDLIESLDDESLVSPLYANA